jgi:hypothetical protein
VLERQFGSRKFGSFIFFTFLLTSLLELSALLSAPKLARKIPPGPYAVLGLMTFFFYSKYGLFLDSSNLVFYFEFHVSRIYTKNSSTPL